MKEAPRPGPPRRSFAAPVGDASVPTLLGRGGYPEKSVANVPTPQGRGDVILPNDAKAKPEEAKPKREAIMIKSDLHKEFAEAKLPKKFFKHLAKLGGGKPTIDRRANERTTRPSAWQQDASTVCENIWDDSESDDEFGHKASTSFGHKASTRSGGGFGRMRSEKFGRQPSEKKGAGFGRQPSEKKGGAKGAAFRHEEPEMAFGNAPSETRRQQFINETAQFLGKQAPEPMQTLPEDAAHIGRTRSKGKEVEGSGYGQQATRTNGMAFGRQPSQKKEAASGKKPAIRS